MVETSATAQWLIQGARSAPGPAQVLQQLCERLIADGLPLWRVAVFVLTPHPAVSGRRLAWVDGQSVTIENFSYERQENEEFRNSPAAHVFATGTALRCRLARVQGPLPYPVLDDLRAQGATDYLATPLVFTNGEIHMVTWTTRKDGGFAEAEIIGIENVVAPLARLAESYALRRTAGNFLDTYVGHQAGERILAGHVRRGDTEAINAAIWLSDMRGFTSLSDRLAPDVMIRLLNRYFDCQVPAILARDGEVLKFMGDGLLAIFPMTAKHQAATICRAALAAAREASSAIAALDRSHGIPGVETIRFGLALHLGEVLYGNIGGGNRLDFTCIGPAVNLAARLEKLTAELKRPILASREFARFCPGDFTSLGDFALRGLGATHAVFGLAESG
jgi:adenylate cyclase